MTRRGFGRGPLTDGATVVILGGGPGGAAAAIALQRGAQALGRRLHIVVVEGKRFAGEQHHNQCVGVLSAPVVELLENELGVPFPHHLSRGRITGYVLHTRRRSLVLDGDGIPSISLRRVQFDAYLLDAVRERGIDVVTARASDVEFHPDRVVIYTESGPLEADVVVGAFGLDVGTAAIFTHAVGYRPPPALTSIVTKYHPGDAGMARFGERIHAFLPPSHRIEFGAITPKGNHLTINIAGAGVDARSMDAFLAAPEVRSAAPLLEHAGSIEPRDLRYFKGAFPCGLAAKFAGDRCVMVGDAAGLVRAFKGKGVTSAIQTSIRAAAVMLQEGISANAFRAYAAANRDITDDLPYGRAIRRLTILASRTGLMDVVLRAAERDRRLRQALYDAVSAHRSYREVTRGILSRGALRAVVSALAGRARDEAADDNETSV